jgi:hypothetical protein
MAYQRSQTKTLFGIALLAASALIGPARAMPLSIEQAQAPVRGDATLDLDVKQPVGQRLEVVSRETLAPLPDAVQTDAGRPSRVNIPKGTSVVIRNAGTRTEAPLPDKETAMNSVLVENVAVEGSATMREIRQWTLAIHAVQTPLVWNAARRAYTTELLGPERPTLWNADELQKTTGLTCRGRGR